MADYEFKSSIPNHRAFIHACVSKLAGIGVVAGEHHLVQVVDLLQAKYRMQSATFLTKLGLVHDLT